MAVWSGGEGRLPETAEGDDESIIDSPTYPASQQDSNSVESDSTSDVGCVKPSQSQAAADPARLPVASNTHRRRQASNTHPRRRKHNQEFGKFCRQYVGGRMAVEQWAQACLTARLWGEEGPEPPLLRPVRPMARQGEGSGQELSDRSRSPKAQERRGKNKTTGIYIHNIK